MSHAPSVTVLYWAEQIDERSIHDLAGIQEFRSELKEEYLSLVRSRPGDLGGLYQLAVHFVSDITLSDVTAFLGAGIAYDLIKSGSKQFLLRPFLRAYERLREKNKNVDIEVLRLEFSDSIVAIDSTFPNAIPSVLGDVLQTLAQNYGALTLPSGETPFEIRIPVLEDRSEASMGGFRAVLEVDEMVSKRAREDYFGFWGLWYDYSHQFRVFDVKRRVLIDHPFLSREEYWRLSHDKWRNEQSR